MIKGVTANGIFLIVLPLTLPGLRRHCEEGDDPEADPPRHRLDVHPEGDPRDKHSQDGGQVALWVACKNAVRVVSGGTLRDQYFRYSHHRRSFIRYLVVW